MMAQRGGFVMGLVAGLLIGLALALGVALYITKAPVPFVNKVPQRTAEQDTAEAERNRSWDPNAPLGGKAARAAAAAASGAAVLAPAASPPVAVLPPPAVAPVVAPVVASVAAAASAAAARPQARDPAAILAGAGIPSAQSQSPAPGPAATTAARPAAAEVFMFFVQAGAYTRADDAEQQRARLGLLGQAAKVTEREQAGRTVYRVRMGPYSSREEADGVQGKLQEQSIEAQIVRVERQ